MNNKGLTLIDSMFIAASFLVCVIFLGINQNMADMAIKIEKENSVKIDSLYNVLIRLEEKVDSQDTVYFHQFMNTDKKVNSISKNLDILSDKVKNIGFVVNKMNNELEQYD